MDRPSEFLEDKEKQDEVFVSTQELGRPSSSYHVENFYQRFKAWVFKQGLHSHGYASLLQSVSSLLKLRPLR